MTMTFARKSRVAAALALALGMSSAAVAQETSSSMRGKIVGPEGNPAANTKIVLIHQPSGTVRELTTNESGAFLAKGLRVGGPYTVIVDSDTFRDKVEEGLSLTLGETYRLNVQLESADEDVERIVVTGSSVAFLSTGAASSYGAEEIARAPSFNRDLKDIVRSNPLATVDADGNLSVGGANPRYNSITVDGIGQNDDFGLNKGGYPTQRSPISLDAIDQISIDSSPFSSKLGGFSGGVINAVTKSGTNEYKGTVFYEFSNDDLAGTPNNKRIEEDPDFDPEDEIANVGIGKERTVGVTLGGPLIKDELFFFVSAEQFDKTTPVPYGIGTGSNESAVSIEDYNRFVSILEEEYQIIDQQSGDPEDSDGKLLLKLDWNINDDHRADFTYQWQNNENGRNYSSSPNTIVMSSSSFVRKTLMRNYATHLYSNWSDDFSTELSLSYKDMQAHNNRNSDMADVNVRAESGSFDFGTDKYRHANIGKTSTLRLAFDANWLIDEHDIKFGYQGERVRLYNLFAQSSNGVWSFAPRDTDGDDEDDTLGLDDFAAGLANTFEYANAYTNNAADTAYTMSRWTHALYIEDTLALTDDLEMTFGLRYERLASSDEPKENDRFTATYGYSNTENLDGLDIILPRVGFKWYVNESMTLRGGVGRYSGGKPNVWIGNSFTNDGITLVAAPSSVTDELIKDAANVDFYNVPVDAQNSLDEGAGSTNFVDPNYKMASDWRYQLGLDLTFDIPYLGEDFEWSIEGNYVEKKDSPFWIDRGRVDNGRRTLDGERVIYDARYADNLSDNYDIMLTNADQDGRSVIFTTALKKAWDNGIRMNLAYTNQDITEANPGSSDTAVANYGYNIVGADRNTALVGTSNYETEHRIVLNLGYKTEFFDGYSTSFDLFFERRSGRPFSWVIGSYFDDDFGDQRELSSNSVYLPYIPTGADDPNVDYSGSYYDANGDRQTFDYERMAELIEAAGLSKYAGGYVPKNSGRQPWVTTLDLNITQEIPGFMDDHKGIIYFNIDNLANLLNDDWGQVHQMRFPQQSLVDLSRLNSNGQYVYSEPFGGADSRNWSDFKAEESTWRIKIGVRYKF